MSDDNLSPELEQTLGARWDHAWRWRSLAHFWRMSSDI